MRIKKLDLIGFKSFKDRTVIQFDAGITGIVGPNGCGKSNIVDGLVWVMGEMSAKDLRGSTMTDVIFAGAENYSPMGMCEVSLTLENDGGPFPAKYLKHSEIMVTRRLHRSGEGEYFINKEPARLRDVQEIFMDTGAGSKGFSIIQQGMIGKIITAKPEDRKHLIEEAAGITKFKARKKESQRKLQSTDQNLLRLQDIIGELKRQLDSLQRQAQKAERYRQVRTQIEELDLWLSTKQYLTHQTAADQAQAIIHEIENLDSENSSLLANSQAQLESLRVDLLQKEAAVTNAQNAHYELQSSLQKQELEIQETKFQVEQAKRNKQMTGTMLEEQKARQSLLIRDQEVYSSKIALLTEEHEKIQNEHQLKNELYQASHEKIQEIDEELTTKRREVFALGQLQSSLDAKVQSLNGQEGEIDERIVSQNESMAELQIRVEEFKGRKSRVAEELATEQRVLEEVQAQLSQSEKLREDIQSQVANRQFEVQEYKDEYNKAASRLYGLESLQNSFEGFDEGVKSVLVWSTERVQRLHPDGQVTPEFKPLSELFEIPSEYELALDAALGNRLQTLVCENAQTSMEALDYLRGGNKGRSSFLPAEVSQISADIEQPQMDANKLNELKARPGVEAVFADVLKGEGAIVGKLKSMLNQTLIVDSLSTALELKKEWPAGSFVTLQGDTLDTLGIITGGSGEGIESGIVKRRREIKELAQAKQEWGGKLQLAQATLKKIEEDLLAATAAFETARKQKQEQDLKVRSLEKDVERADNEVYNSESAFAKEQRELVRLMDQLEQLRSRREQMEINLSETREKKFALDQETETLTQDLNATKDGFDALMSEVTLISQKLSQKTTELETSKAHLELIQKSLAELEIAVNRMVEEEETNEVTMTEGLLQMEEKKIQFERQLQQVESLKLAVGRAKDEYEQDLTRSRELDEQVRLLSREKSDRFRQLTEAQMQLEQSKLKEQYLVDQVRERYMLNLPDLLEKYASQELDLQESEREIKELREKMNKMGEVNLSSIEEFDDTQKRYAFLTQQQDDLVEAKDQLRKVIDRINKICSRRFKETFDLVNERFTKVFPVLFGGGEAKLELHEDAESGEMGIEIIARPPGKKMQNVSLMSGGEKALTAVSLVFAIFLVKPSPYCLLDEVDAPLDDANVFRFNELVREMSKRSQIIVVTHNKHTMEVAKKLYGVTMQEKGVSTMVSVNLQDLN